MTNDDEIHTAAKSTHSDPTVSSHVQMSLKVGVMGGAGADIPAEYLAKASQLGEAIASAGCIVVTGACPGLPMAAARGAKRAGGLVIGISPALSLDEHAFKYESPTLAHDVLIFTGSGLMGREVVNIRSSDIVVIVGGSSGTLGELAIAYDEGKLIGVLTGTGGISDMAKDILATCKKETGARVVYENDPRLLMEQLFDIYSTEHFRRPSVFCRGTTDATESPAEGSQQDVVAECGSRHAKLQPGEREMESDLSSVRFSVRNALTPARYSSLTVDATILRLLGVLDHARRRNGKSRGRDCSRPYL